MERILQKNETVNNWSYDSVTVCPKNRYVKAYYHRLEALDYHTHDFYELNIVTDGSGIHRIGQRELRAELGDVFVIPPGMGHGYRSSGSLTVFHLLLSERFMNSFGILFENIGGYKTLFNVEPELRSRTEFSYFLRAQSLSLEALFSLLEGIKEKSRANSDREELDSAFLAGQLITFLSEAIGKKSAEGAVRVADKRNLSVIGAMEYLDSHPDEPLDTEGLSAKCCMSYSGFLRAFRRLSGVTPSEYLAAARIKKARILLSGGSKTVLEIAMSLGYYDSAHFIKEFTRREGLTPTEYRKKLRI